MLAPSLLAADFTLHTFKKLPLTDKFWTEAPAFGDLNLDGSADVVVGPYWFEGPGFKKRHVYTSALQTFDRQRADGSWEAVEGYATGIDTPETQDVDRFCVIVDLNHDGWPDILSAGPILVSDGTKVLVWYENPGAKSSSKAVYWRKHVVAEQVDNQSDVYVDLLGDGQRVLVAMSHGEAGYFKPDPKDPTLPWVFHPISEKSDEFRWYTHGLGVGDLNGDGRLDVLHSDGWWEQPLLPDTGQLWKYHPYPFGLGPSQIKFGNLIADVTPDGVPHPVTVYGNSQLYVDDLNGDGLPDVIASITAHGYGLAWWEQLKEPNRLIGGPQFRRHLIMNKESSESKYGVSFSEPQGVAWIDIDGDGLKDIVAGKRFWSHGCCLDPESSAPAVLYWFRQVRSAGGGVDFIPYLIDDNSGAGNQIAVGDVNGDGLPDIAVANKKGAFVFLQTVKHVSQAEWQKAQPPLLPPKVP